MDKEIMVYPSGQAHVPSAHEQVDAAVLVLVNLIAQHVARELALEVHSEKLGIVSYPED